MTQEGRRPGAGRYRRDPLYGKPPQWAKEYGKYFPTHTDACSRHCVLIADDMLRDPKSPVRRLLIDAGYEPDHLAQSIEYTVLSLWRNRAALASAVAESDAPDTDGGSHAE